MVERLRKWAQDEPHLAQSSGSYRPHYPNPAALRRDVRALLAERDAARQQAQTLRELAKRATAQAAAPDYDEEAIRAALWALVDAAVAVPDTEKGAEQVAQSAESGDVRGGEQR